MQKITRKLFLKQLSRDELLRVGRLARIELSDGLIEKTLDYFNKKPGFFEFIETLQSVDTTGVEPMTSVVHMDMKQRDDEVDDGGKSDDIVENSKHAEDDYFTVPKVID